jgi:branched-chain amino acid transport system permease protein
MDMKRDYYEDIELFSSGTILGWSMALLIFLFTLLLYLPSYNIYLINIILVNVILAVGLNILVGNTGQISLGHAGFFAIGAYGNFGNPFERSLCLLFFKQYVRRLR